MHVPLSPATAWFCIVVGGSLPAFLMGVNTVTGACFAAGPAYLRKGGPRTIASVVLLTIWQYYVYMCLYHAPLFRETLCTRLERCSGWSVEDLVYAVFQYDQTWRLAQYHVVMALWLWAWRRAIVTDPTCPVQTGELRNLEQRIRGVEEEPRTQTTNLRLRASHPPREASDKLYTAYAAMKDRHRAMGSRTCTEIGGGVVPGFDHYCPLINNAVGRANRKFFLQTLVYQMWSAVYLLADGIPVATQLFVAPSWPTLNEPQIAIGTVLSIHINLICLFLLLTQLAVLPVGISTVELWAFLPWVRGVRARSPTFPSIRNIKAELGPMSLWALPLAWE